MVAGENEINVAVVSVGESSEVSDAAHDVLSWIERVFDAHVFGGGGHELHEPHGACVADGTRVEIAFDFDDGSDEGFGDAIKLRGFGDIGCVEFGAFFGRRFLHARGGVFGY